MQGVGLYEGKFDLLQNWVAEIDPNGTWRELDGHWQFRATNRGIMNWWPRTGTMQFQGRKVGSEELHDRLRDKVSQGSPRPAKLSRHKGALDRRTMPTRRLKR